MKIPRLALLALLLAPVANAALPNWPVIEEGPRSWARVFFTVGKETRTLRCRYSECKPENKAQSNLYIIAPVGAATPTKVTIFKMIPRSKWNPAYHIDGPYEKVPEVINAKAQPYSSELSHFKLDNTGSQLVVVQGDKKYPATTDISQAQYNSYDQLKVAPPAKMADDLVKPEAPAQTPPVTAPVPPRRPAQVTFWCDPKEGKITPVPPGKKPVGAYPVEKKDSPCAKGPKPDVPPVVTVPTPVGVESVLLLSKKELTWLDKNRQARDYEAAKTAAASKPADQKAAALAEAVKNARKQIAENLQPRKDVSDAYEAAVRDPKATQETIDKSISIEIWGGADNKTFVELFGERPDIQLSKADWETLGKDPKHKTALNAYIESRRAADGRRGQSPDFVVDNYDPIVLHRTAEAARKALGIVPGTKPPVVAPKPEVPVTIAPLSEEELALLTPAERMEYERLQKNVRDKLDPKAPQLLADETDRLRKLTENRRGASPAYAPPKDLAAFNKMPDWQKDKFCDPKIAGAAVAETGPTTSATTLNTGPAMPNLEDVDAKLKAEQLAAAQKAAAQAAATLPDWARGPCAQYLASKVPPPSGGSSGGSSGGGSAINGNIANGNNNEGPGKRKPIEWMSIPLAQTAFVGGLTGLLIGSLFGPVGLIAGPLLGAALYYGLSVYKADKAKNPPAGGEE